MSESLRDNEGRINGIVNNLIRGMFDRWQVFFKPSDVEDVWQIIDAAILLGYRPPTPSPVPPTPGPDGLDRTEDGRTDCTGTGTVRTVPESSTSSGPSILRSSGSSPVQGGTGGEAAAIAERLRSIGMTSPRHIEDGSANLAKFADPLGILAVLERHCGRFRSGASALPLLAHIIQKTDQIKAVVREMADKENDQRLMGLLRAMRAV